VENLAPDLDDRAAEEHALALDEVDRLARVCDGLLALAAADTGHTAEPATVDASAIAVARVAAWRPVAGRAGVALSSPTLEPVSAQALDGALDQVLDVLLDNAIKFAGAGATITVTAVREGVHAVVEVVDDGPGLPGETLADAVQPYWRAAGPQIRAGSGLGLAIVATLLATGGGELALHQAEPHGLHARVRLPTPTASPAGSSAPHRDATATGTSPPPPAHRDAAPPDAPPPAAPWL
jgi:signal transduction histidine kinase